MKKFSRKREGKVWFGFCAGLGDYFQIDPILFRLLFVAAVVGGAGLGIIFYFIAVLLTPYEPGE